MLIKGGLRAIAKELKKPKLSIIIATYNAESHIPALLNNIRQFKNGDIELIIKDGGSSDDTLNLLKLNDDLIDFWISGKDTGIYDALNIAVTYAKGNWFYFMGADDRLLPGFSKAFSRLETSNVVYYAQVIIQGKVIGRPYKKYDFTKAELCHQSIFYPALLFKHYHYDTVYKVAADHILNMRSFTDKRFKWHFIEELIAVYDTHGFSAQNKDEVLLRNYKRIIRTHLGVTTYFRYLFKQFKMRNRR